MTNDEFQKLADELHLHRIHPGIINGFRALFERVEGLEHSDRMQDGKLSGLTAIATDDFAKLMAHVAELEHYRETGAGIRDMLATIPGFNGVSQKEFDALRKLVEDIAVMGEKGRLRIGEEMIGLSSRVGKVEAAQLLPVMESVRNEIDDFIGISKIPLRGFRRPDAYIPLLAGQEEPAVRAFWSAFLKDRDAGMTEGAATLDALRAAWLVHYPDQRDDRDQKHARWYRILRKHLTRLKLTFTDGSPTGDFSKVERIQLVGSRHVTDGVSVDAAMAVLESQLSVDFWRGRDALVPEFDPPRWIRFEDQLPAMHQRVWIWNGKRFGSEIQVCVWGPRSIYVRCSYWTEAVAPELP